MLCCSPDAPPGHIADDADFDTDDGEGDPEGADVVGDEDQGNDDHDAGRNEDALDSLGKNGQVLVNIDEEGMEDGDGEIVGGVAHADVAELLQHLLLHV